MLALPAIVMHVITFADSQVRGSDGALAAEKTPSDLLAPLDALCLYRIEDWWTYELCYAKSVRQFHKEGDKARNSTLAVCTHACPCTVSMPS